MSDFQFIIDSHYCKNSSLLKIGIDFSFIINGNRFVTTQNHASVISGIVRDILITDESATEINISIPDNGSLEKSLNIFSIFLRNGYIKENIDLLTSETLYHIGVSIENEDFINQYINIMTISNITKDNIKSFINYSLKTHDFEKTSTFIASNLSHIGPSICSSLIQSVFDTIKDQILVSKKEDILINFAASILSNTHLAVFTEDDVCEFVISMCKSLSEVNKLVSYIMFEFCTKKAVINYINYYMGLLNQNWNESNSSNKINDETLIFCQLFEDLLTKEFEYVSSTRENTLEFDSTTIASFNSKSIYLLFVKCSNERDLKSIKYAVDK